MSIYHSLFRTNSKHNHRREHDAMHHGAPCTLRPRGHSMQMAAEPLTQIWQSCGKGPCRWREARETKSTNVGQVRKGTKGVPMWTCSNGLQETGRMGKGKDQRRGKDKKICMTEEGLEPPTVRKFASNMCHHATPVRFPTTNTYLHPLART